MAKSAFGEHLRREREMRGVSLEEIASATRISVRFLEALENEHWDRLPGGVFNRGFIRAVARFLGLDEESLVAEYAVATNDKPEVAVWVTQTQPPRRAWPWVLALTLVALAAGGWLAYPYVEPLISAWREPVAEVPRPAPPVAPGASADATLSPSPSPAAGAAAPAEPEFLELKVEAGRVTGITIAADGRTIFDGRLEPGQTKHYRAREKFEVSVGNSSAVLLELNGQTVPPLGAPGEPGSVTLTRKDLKKAGGQD